MIAMQPQLAASDAHGYVQTVSGIYVPEDHIRPGPSRHDRRARRGLGFEGTRDSEHTEDWLHADAHPAERITLHLTKLRQRSRWLARHAPPFISALNTLCDDVIGGKGMQVQARTWLDDDETRPNRRLNKLIERKFRQWCKRADVDGRESLWMQLWTATREFVEGGEFFLEKVVESTRKSGKRVPLSVRVIRSERIDHTLNRDPRDGKGGKPRRNRITNGIEFDADGRRVAYWITPEHPDGVTLSYAKPERVPAHRILHVFIRLWAGQERGIPWLFGATMLCHDLDDLVESELTSAEVAACLAALITRQGGGRISQLQERQEDDQRPLHRIRSGAILDLPEGSNAHVIKGERPGGTFDPFVTFLTRSIAKVLGTSYERTTGDYSKVNFASSRMGEIQDNKVIERIQSIVVQLAVAPIFVEWLRLAILADEVPIDIVDFLSEPEAYTELDVIPPARPPHDELKGATAAAIRVAGGQSTDAIECARLGFDWEMINEQRQRELEDKRDRGIPIMSVGGAQVVTGQGDGGNPGFEEEVEEEEEPNDENGDAARSLESAGDLDWDLIKSLMQEETRDAA